MFLLLLNWSNRNEFKLNGFSGFNQQLLLETDLSYGCDLYLDHQETLEISELVTRFNQQLSNIDISTSVPQLHIVVRDDTTKKSLTRVMVSGKYPPDTLKYLYKDGSATSAIQYGGAG